MCSTLFLPRRGINWKNRGLADGKGDFQNDEVWDIIKSFCSDKHPHTCVECTFYMPINQQWFEERAKGNDN